MTSGASCDLQCTYRSTVATRSGVFLLGVSAENRASAGVALFAGD